MGYPDSRRASADNGNDSATPMMATTDFNSRPGPATRGAHDSSSRSMLRAWAATCNRWSEESRESLRGRRLYILFALVNLVNYIDRGIIPGGSEEFNMFIRQKLHSDQPDVFLGLLQSAFILGFSVACLIFARLAHVHSPFTLMGVGLSVWCVSSVMAGIAHPLGSYAVLFVGRLLSGVGEASFITVVPPLITETAPPGERGLWLALFYTAMPVGAGLGYVYGSVMATSSLGWPWAFFLETLVMAPLALACSLVPHENATSVPNSAHYGTSSVVGSKPASNSNESSKCSGPGAGGSISNGSRSARRPHGRDCERREAVVGERGGDELGELRGGAGVRAGAEKGYRFDQERTTCSLGEEDTSDEGWSVDVDRASGASARSTWPEHNGVGGVDKDGELRLLSPGRNDSEWHETRGDVESREGATGEMPYGGGPTGAREEVGLVEMGNGIRGGGSRKPPPLESSHGGTRGNSGNQGPGAEGVPLNEDLMRVVNRPVFCLVVLGAAANAAVTAGMSTFGTGFVTSLELLRTETAAAATFGSVICIAGIVGTPAGGAFIDSADPEGRLSDARKLYVVLRQGFWLVSGATVFLVLATAQSALIPFLILTFLGGTLLFACTPHMNLAVMLASPHRLRPLALAINSVAVHALGDVPSPAAIGALKDALAPHCAGAVADSLQNAWTGISMGLARATGGRGWGSLGEISEACRSERGGLHLTLFIMSAWLLWMSVFFAMATMLQNVALKGNSSPLLWADIPRCVFGHSSRRNHKKGCCWRLSGRPAERASTLSINEAELDDTSLGQPLLVSSP